MTPTDGGRDGTQSLEREKTGACGYLRLVHQELDQKFDHAVIQAHHFSVLHALVQAHAFRAPEKVFPGVVHVCLHGQGHRVELVAEEGEEHAVCDHRLRHKGPADVLVVPEACRGETEV